MSKPSSIRGLVLTVAFGYGLPEYRTFVLSLRRHYKGEAIIISDAGAASEASQLCVAHNVTMLHVDMAPKLFRHTRFSRFAELCHLPEHYCLSIDFRDSFFQVSALREEREGGERESVLVREGGAAHRSHSRDSQFSGPGLATRRTPSQTSTSSAAARREACRPASAALGRGEPALDLLGVRVGMPPDLLLSQEGVATWPHSGYTLGERWMQKSWVEQCFGKETAAAMQASDAPRPTPLSAPAAAAAEAGASHARGAAMPRRDSRVTAAGHPPETPLTHLGHTSASLAA